MPYAHIPVVYFVISTSFWHTETTSRRLWEAMDPVPDHTVLKWITSCCLLLMKWSVIQDKTRLTISRLNIMHASLYFLTAWLLTSRKEKLVKMSKTPIKFCEVNENIILQWHKIFFVIWKFACDLDIYVCTQYWTCAYWYTCTCADLEGGRGGGVRIPPGICKA